MLSCVLKKEGALIWTTVSQRSVSELTAENARVSNAYKENYHYRIYIYTVTYK